MDEWRRQLRDVVAEWKLPPDEEAALVDELEEHLDLEFAELRMRVGDVAAYERIREQVTDQALRTAVVRPRRAAPAKNDVFPSRAAGLSSLVRGVRYGWRSLRREPAFTLFVVVALALGIGMNAVIYSVADRLLFHGPADIANAAEVARLYHAEREPNGRMDTTSVFDYPAFAAIERNTHSFAAIAGYAALAGTLGRGRDAKPINVGYASAAFFGTLGTGCIIGRCLTPVDTTETSTRAAVIDFGLWRSQFNGDKSILGRTVLVDEHPVVVVGVAPDGFTGAELARVDVWLPIDVLGTRLTPNYRTEWDGPWMMIVARFGDPTSRAAALAEATAVVRHAYAGEDPGSAQTTIEQAPLTFGATAKLSNQSVVAKWLVVLGLVVLLLACTNAINLMLARVSRRRQEIVVRRALGGGRGQIVGLFITEGILLASFGGLAALLVAAGGSALVRKELLSGIGWPSSALDVQLVCICAGVAAVIGLAIGVAPALHALRFDVAQGLKASGGNRVSGDARRGYVGIAVQCMLSTVLLACAGLFVQSLRNVTGIDSGVDPRRIVVVTVNWPRIFSTTKDTTNAELHRRLAFLNDAVSRLNRSSVIEVASLGTGLPMWSGYRQAKVHVQGALLESSGSRPFPYSAVTAGYFEATHTRLERGRPFATSDDQGAGPVAIVNDTLARLLWKSGNPVGQCLFLDDSAACTRVVGISANTRNAIGQLRPDLFRVLSQVPVRDTPRLFVRPRGTSEADIAATTRAIRDDLLARDAAIDYVEVKTLQQWMDPSFQQWRLGALMFGALGSLALLVGVVGLYSNVFYTTERRRREIAIRLAVGASRTHVMILVMGRAIVATIIGATAGLACVWIGRRSIEPLLFKTAADNPAILIPTLAVLVAVAAGATLPSVFRSNRIDPIEALRAD
jgi:predicted permease